MINNQTMVNYPVFADSGTKTQPSQTNYSRGFIPGEVFPAEWENWIENKTSQAITTLNAGTESMEKEINNVLSAAGKEPDVSDNTQLLQSIRYLLQQTQMNTLLAAHPVGSLYWSSDPTNPAQLFGGTWQAITDRFILAAGSTYETVNIGNSTANGGGGGTDSVTLTTNNIPAHTHPVGFTNLKTPESYIYKTIDGSEKRINLVGRCVEEGINQYAASPIIQNATETGTVTLTMKAGVTSQTSGNNPMAALSSSGARGSYSPASHRHNMQHEHDITHYHKLTWSGNTSNNSTTESAIDIMNPYIVKYCWERIS